MSVWFPDAIRDPGKNAGYRRGHTKNRLAVLHFTVGTNSRALIRDQGLAAFLFPKDRRPWQFCEADSITSHACEWNDEGPGLEFERLNWGEPLTSTQLKYGGACIAWLHDTFGIPLVWHGGARLPIGSGFRGFVNHGSLMHQACDQHTDGITMDEWAAMAETEASEEELMRIVSRNDGSGYANKLLSPWGWTFEWKGEHVAYSVQRGAQPWLAAGVPFAALKPADYDALPKTPTWATGGGGTVPLKVTLSGVAQP